MLKVDNAIIMAAGLSSRFMPLSLEIPKGLLRVKGEILIERQIEMLKEKGINDITVVVGYKKEAFYYLKDKYNVKIVVNPCFNTKNNIETLYLVRDSLKNTYICSSDDYFTENPFSEYEDDAYYAGEHVDVPTDEWYMIGDSDDNIVRIDKTGSGGSIMLGHAFYSKKFSDAFVPLIEKAHESGEYDSVLWEQLLSDNLSTLPKMKIREYPKGVIFEFDTLDELRAFDSKYINDTGSKIMANIAKVFSVKEGEITDFHAMTKGLTNASFVFTQNGKKYVYRHPGEGTEKIISRKHEKVSLEIAKKYDIDPTFIFMDDNEGFKISSYVDGVRTPSYDSFDDSKRVLEVLRRLHKIDVSVDWTFKPYDDAMNMEKLMKENGSIHLDGFETLKKNIEYCYNKTIGDGVKMCFCHSDTYAPNWMFTDDKTILIDWEYAGEADPGCDLGCYIMDAEWEVDKAIEFIKEYLKGDSTPSLIFHHLAYTAIVSYYWTVWALYRESCGAVLTEELRKWGGMARRYSSYLANL